MPEIALTAQSLARFSARFGGAPALWHSDLKFKQRRETWLAAGNGDAKVVIGARSALFLPFENLGLIVVDEEHDAAFKQEDGVIYHARDMAIVRAREGKIPIILSTATPSIETLMNVRAKTLRRSTVTKAIWHGANAFDFVNRHENEPARERTMGPRVVGATVGPDGE